ncbi:hypothetical protein RN001_015826 [Aquatica leii]|uniref:Peptidase S1 domain-containing protein n=1 Tax=Aquatica leii TaxID=1421715 RepID=A0AAN7PNH4_9COLE|nr:hypothetical protein RN001_015826 [Aquatica leii]
MTVKYKLQFLVVSYVLLNSIAQKNVGDRCVMRGTNVQGICTLISNCPEADNKAKQGVTPTTCGFFHSRTPIVCCTERLFPRPNENSFLDPQEEGFLFPDSNERESTPIERFVSKSEEKCIEYSKLVTGVVNAVPLVTDPEEVSIDVVKCDHNGVALIVGGSPASPGEFPFMAAIGYNTDDGIGWLCGGTLISEYFVITAAHCANSRFYGAPITIRLGDIDLKRSDDGTEYVDYDIQDIKVHEQYKPPTHYHDIALLKTVKEVKFTNFIRPACLWSKFEIDHNISVATGWGKTGYLDNQSDKLLKVALNIFENSVCSKAYTTDSLRLPNGIISNMLCAGELAGGKDTCQGDSGGPLIVSNPKNRCISYIVGITSFGKGCGGANVPAVYTRISQYLPWIEKHIW